MELAKRKQIRLKGYDYSQNGAYFITICTHNRKCLFSNINVVVGAIHESPENNYDNNCKNNCKNNYENKLTQYGKIVKQIIEILPNRFNVSIPKYVIMPNHIHLIIEINNDNDTRAIRADEIRAIHESPQHNRSTIDKAVGFLKMNASKKIHNEYADKIWQRSYHDHIIRGENDYQKIWEYIDTNVIKWKGDCFYNSEK